MSFFIENLEPNHTFEFFSIYVSLFISCLLSIILYVVVILFTYKQYELEKVSAYECGFHPFEDTRERFNIHFYLIAILFIIFDLEIIFLIPFVLGFCYIDFFAFFNIFIFIYILTIGFLYEWLNGALDWE